MSDRPRRPALNLEWLKGPRGLWAVGLVVLLLAIFWLAPRRVGRLVTVDGQDVGAAPAGAPTRQVVWSPAEAIEVEVSSDQGPIDLITPRLTGGEQTLLLTRRDEAGRLDIYESHRRDGQWEPAVPLPAINSSANDIGPLLADEGQTLYFFSNREGGHGGYDLY